MIIIADSFFFYCSSTVHVLSSLLLHNMFACYECFECRRMVPFILLSWVAEAQLSQERLHFPAAVNVEIV